MLAIQPQYLTLAKLLDKRLFRIPEYQRAYSWASQQRQDLFSDITKTYRKEEDDGHFMAALVCLHRKRQSLGTDEYYVMDVVDGQQRLTTLIILLKTISISLDKSDVKEIKLAAEIFELLVKSEGDELLLLQTNHDSSHHFANYLRTSTYQSSESAKTLADKSLLKAIEDCILFVSKWKEDGYSLLELAALLKNRIFFLLHEINDEKTVYTVFEVLNSRGLDVSWLDRLKSIFMGNAFELKAIDNDSLIRELHNKWKDIYKIIGLRQGMNTQALRIAATLKVNYEQNRLLGEADAVNTLRLIADSAKGLRDISSWLLEVTEACDIVLSNTRINAVTRISQARLLAIAIHLKKGIKETDRDKLLSLWEKVSFRIYGLLGKDSRTGVGDYVRLSWKIINTEISVSETYDEIKKIGASFTIEDAIKNITEANCYEGWEHELRYLMYRYEEFLTKNKGLKFKNEQWEKIWLVSPSESIEHIWAQSTAPEKQKHKLGNLVLLPPKLNSKLRDNLAKNKAGEYRLTGLLISSEAADLIDKAPWNTKAIKERTEHIAKWIKQEWAD